MNHSPLLSQSYLFPKNKAAKKKNTGLIITSLVDAFSILVIYLLFGPSISGEAVNPEMNIQLPIAYASQLTDNETTIKVKNKLYYLQNEVLTSAQLGPALKKLALVMQAQNKSIKAPAINLKNETKGVENSKIFDKSMAIKKSKINEKSLVIIADKNGGIEDINPILIAASEAGMTQLRLAVEHQGE